MSPARSWLPWLVALVLAVGGCQCDTPPGTGNARGDFEAQEAELDFGRVLEGKQARRELTLLGTGRAYVNVSASARSPFALTSPSVEVPGGGTAPLAVVFTAGDGPAEDVLVLEGAGRTVRVTLRGLGVKPLPCPAPDACHESHFDLESGACVDSPARDGSACETGSRCQVNGRCQAGVCVGAPRTCDDDNPCTDDACSPDDGCVTTPVACPRPKNPCKVGVCEREKGCGEANAANFTPCGPIDCVDANVCIAGTCRTVPTPEGFVCAPGTMCQDEGRCTGGKCVRPDAGELTPAFAQELGGEPVVEPGGPALVSQGSALYASVCGGDGGCRLVSFTNEGLLRFEAPWPEGGPRMLLAASDAGVVVHEPGVLEAYAPSGPGARLWRVSAESLAPDASVGPVSKWGPGRVALTSTNEVVTLVSRGDAGELSVLAEAADGGVRVVDALTLEGLGGPSSLALDEEGRAFAYAQGGPVVRVEPGDGGLQSTRLREAAQGDNAALAVTGGWIFAGTRSFLETQGRDGGTVNWEATAALTTPLESPALLLDGTGYAFARLCREPPCAADAERLLLRALEARDGTVRWEVQVLPFDAPGVLYEAALLEGGFVGTLTQSTLPTGTLTHVQVLGPQGRLSVCPLEGRPRVAGALFAGSYLYVLLQRDGAWRLEAFTLGFGAIPEVAGWPQRNGARSTRRPGP
ncbi:hypothetical protein P2318_29620 [Myxococcaceae bacterium GXIMD 01537]